MRRLIVGIVLLVAASGTGSQTQASARNFLWVVARDGAPPSYLLGSLHVLTPEYYPLSPRIEAAFAGSTVLIQEVDLEELANPATVLSVAAKAMLPEGTTLDQLVPRELYAQVLERAAKAGVPAAALQRMKPWMAALSLTTPAMQAAGFKGEHGVDRHFYERAREAGMSRRALETVAFQFDRLDGMAAQDQEALLRSTLEDLDAQIANVKTIAAAWARGDTAELERELLGSFKEWPRLYQRMLVERNVSWVPAVERCLQERVSCFVVVGAAHLVGPDSLVALLQAKGYRVDQH